MTEPKKPAHPRASVGFIAGAAGGWAFSQYCGASVWIPGAAVIWLWLRPGLAAAIFLGLFQIASFAINFFSLAAATCGDAAHRALTAHCVFRLIAITCLVVGYIRWRRERSASIAVNSAAPTQ